MEARGEDHLFLRPSRFSVTTTNRRLRSSSWFKLGAFTYREIAMRIYVFKSETTDRLRAFAGDPDVNKLPRQHDPWTVTGTITPDNAPLYNLSRDAIEKAIRRLRKKK
jgi:hypothetical protein